MLRSKALCVFRSKTVFLIKTETLLCLASKTLFLLESKTLFLLKPKTLLLSLRKRCCALTNKTALVCEQDMELAQKPGIGPNLTKFGGDADPPILGDR